MQIFMSSGYVVPGDNKATNLDHKYLRITKIRAILDNWIFGEGFSVVN